MERKKGIRTAADSGQSGCPVVASRKSNRSRENHAIFARRRSCETKTETCELLLEKREKKNRGARAGVTVIASYHPTVSTRLFADDSAALTQGVHLNYTIKAMQNYLVILENWLIDWRIAINVEKTQAIVFRKWGVIDPQTEIYFLKTTFIGSRSFVTWAYTSIVD
ncbi:hypothetical protein TNCV_2878961 [Trichonephila clavipes]|uniref:RNA-directed DNA polymerase from mobile element jockey n=1 Tax=Trichonephila clavipes TaxID=2585209 RepID=A0A8X7BC52_TRICX|nr:hypothetical protein TNCV_2878961 [Trichonephila clavipes]